jgi:prefoldin subunit 5
MNMLEDPRFTKEQVAALKRIWDERFREPAGKRIGEGAVTWIAFLSESSHWYNRLAEEGEPDPWTVLTNALYSIDPDVTIDEFISELEDYFHIPYEKPKPPEVTTPAPREEIRKEVEKAVKPIEKQFEETRKALEETRKALEEIRKAFERVVPTPPTAAPPKPVPPPKAPPKFTESQERIILTLAGEIERRVDRLRSLGYLTDEQASEYRSEVSTARLTSLIEKLRRGEVEYEDVRNEFQTKLDTLKDIEAVESKRRREVTAPPSAEVGLPSPPPLGKLGRGVGDTYASLTFPTVVVVEERKYGFMHKKEDALKKFESMSKYFDRYTGPIVREYKSGTYYEYEFIVPVLDINTVNTLRLIIPFPLDYWYGGGYLYEIWGIGDCPLDVWFKMYGNDSMIMPPQFRPWFEAVCTRVVPEIRRLKYDAIGKYFPLT